MITEEEKEQRRREAQKRYRESHKEQIKAYSLVYNKKHYAEHKEERREEHNKQERERYQTKKDLILSLRRESYKTNKEIILERNKKWKDEHPEYMKQWRDDNSDHIKEYLKKYSKTPMGRAANLVSAYKQRDKKYGRGECTITAQWILENIFGKPCEYCGKVYDWKEIGCDRKDSSLPHTLENCVPCCLSCNSKKGKMSYDEFKEKMRSH